MKHGIVLHKDDEGFAVIVTPSAKRGILRPVLVGPVPQDQVASTVTIVLRQGAEEAPAASIRTTGD